MFNVPKIYITFTMIYYFYLKRIKIGNVGNLVVNLRDKTEYAIHIRNLKQTINRGSVLKKVHRVNNFNQNAWRNPYTAMNT